MKAYLDNAATTPPDPAVVDEIKRVLDTVWGNPSSVHKTGKQARKLIEDSRNKIAHYLKADAKEIYFTSGATEAIATILWGAARGEGVKRIISGKTEHSAVRRNLEAIAAKTETEVCYTGLNPDGTPCLNMLEKMLREDKGRTMVALMHGNNETGSISPIEEIGKLCKKNNAIFFSDTVQTIGKYIISPAEQHIDYFVGTAHKFHGPKGCGFFYARNGHRLKPCFVGGGQESNMRSGTENIYGIAGLAKAFECAYENINSNNQHLMHLKKLLIDSLKEKIPGLTFFAGCDKTGMNHIINIGLEKNSHNELLYIKLDMNNIAVSAGSACSSGDIKLPNSLSEMGVSDDYISLRISTGRFTSQEEILYFTDTLKTLCKS